MAGKTAGNFLRVALRGDSLLTNPKLNKGARGLVGSEQCD